MYQGTNPLTVAQSIRFSEDQHGEGYWSDLEIAERQGQDYRMTASSSVRHGASVTRVQMSYRGWVVHFQQNPSRQFSTWAYKWAGGDYGGGDLEAQTYTHYSENLATALVAVQAEIDEIEAG